MVGAFVSVTPPAFAPAGEPERQFNFPRCRFGDAGSRIIRPWSASGVNAEGSRSTVEPQSRRLLKPGPFAPQANSGSNGINSTNGCMIANTAAEMPPRDKKIRNLVQVMLKTREEAIFKALVRAQEEGELSPQKNARHLAQYLNTFLLGLGILARTSPDPKTIKTVVNESLQILD